MIALFKYVADCYLRDLLSLKGGFYRTYATVDLQTISPSLTIHGASCNCVPSNLPEVAFS